MPSLANGTKNPKKRKSESKSSTKSSSKRRVVADDGIDDESVKIVELEAQVSESRKYYNNIATLLSMLNVKESAQSPNLAVAVSLCRVFCRLIAGSQLTEDTRAAESERMIALWLNERLQEYQKALLALLKHGDPSSQVTALTLCMRLVKERSVHFDVPELRGASNGFFKDLIAALMEAPDGQILRDEFAEKFIQEYDDIRYSTFAQIADYAIAERGPDIIGNIISVLTKIDTIPSQDQTFESFYAEPGQKTKNPLYSITSHKKRAQEAWLAILRNKLKVPQRKTLLRLMSHPIAPWFLKPELLMDFLTDSYDIGGATSLLALSGLFYLIQEKNLDYPQFYPKLYSLLDSDLLHSKHRSRFFRLMNTFLSSSHLPSTLVASFIKRLSRLALNAPPAAIVAIVPWIYNLLMAHPTCTFMLHRVVRDKEWQAELDEEGMDDPFDPMEPDPTLTDAIESSLWEIETLQSHYHPNVASLARIISEQFTKRAYNIEDFLDHSYQGMLSAELGRGDNALKRTPVVEFQIPRRIFTDRGLEEDGRKDVAPGALLRELWDF